MNKENEGGVLRLFEMLKGATVTRRALRFYEEQGLLPPAGRDRYGRRIYMDSDLLRLKLIRTLRNAGLPIASIRDVLDSRVVRQGDPPAVWLERMQNVLVRYADGLSEQIASMQAGEQAMRDAAAWLGAQEPALCQRPEAATSDPATPLIVRALLSQPSTLTAAPPRRPGRVMESFPPGL